MHRQGLVYLLSSTSRERSCANTKPNAGKEGKRSSHPLLYSALLCQGIKHGLTKIKRRQTQTPSSPPAMTPRPRPTMRPVAVAVVNAEYPGKRRCAKIMARRRRPTRCPRGLLVRSCAQLPHARLFLSVSLVSLVPALFFLSPRLLFSLQSNLVRFCAVVHERLLEPRVLERLLGRNTLLGIVHEYSPQQVEELLVEIRVPGYCFLRMSVRANSKQRRDVRGASSSPLHISSTPC